MSQSPTSILASHKFRLGDLPPELILQIAEFVPAQALCKLCQTCKQLYSLLSKAATGKTRAVAQALAPKEEYEQMGFYWNDPNKIGKEVPDDYDSTLFEGRVGILPDLEVLPYAVVKGDLKTVRYLLDAGADANSFSVDGRYLLYLALKAKSPAMVTLLLTYDAEPDALNIYDEDAIWKLALHTQEAALITPFLIYDIDDFANLVTMLCTGEVVQACIDAGMDLNEVSFAQETVAHSLGRRNCKEMFALVAPHLTSETWKMSTVMGFTPLHLNMLYDETPMLLMDFIDAGVDVNAVDESSCTALAYAIENGHTDTARCIFEMNQDRPLHEYTGGVELVKAVKAGDVDMIRLLMSLGMRADHKVKYRDSALVCAARGSLEIFKLVYEEGPGVRPSLNGTRGRLDSPSPYATALLHGEDTVVRYIETIIDGEHGDPYVPWTPENESHVALVRNVVGAAACLYIWSPQPTENHCQKSKLQEIAARVLLLAGGNLDSEKTRDIIRAMGTLLPFPDSLIDIESRINRAIKDSFPSTLSTDEINHERAYAIARFANMADDQTIDQLVCAIQGLSVEGDTDRTDDIIQVISRHSSLIPSEANPGRVHKFLQVIEPLLRLAEEEAEAHSRALRHPKEASDPDKTFLLGRAFSRYLYVVRKDHSSELMRLSEKSVMGIFEHHTKTVRDRPEKYSSDRLRRLEWLLIRFKYLAGQDDCADEKAEMARVFMRLIRC
ncbi:hypothetical protein N7457_001719 [Penicillium paradoxum]|uniref:uncharacterized protein n=1 Tax=Penicillium paradoxum TaxID=176176 RepID=UPI00254785B8|nr:uncharacterized protein N7457_001719 [Penicillium paradoxum]KAJ5795120.1 hypothetical protein N7457_001719 [Penicillium paradoxum]